MTSNNPANQEEQPTQEIEESSNVSIHSTSATSSDIPEFGWSNYAERINGRFAMIGFSALLIIEFFTNSSFLQWAGITH